jgi:Ca-activated chloride channel homolog
MRIEARPDRTLIRSGASSIRYVKVGIEAPTAERREDRMPVNISLVLDRSGSMGGGKIELARRAAEQAIRQLRPEDRFSVVIFDTEVDVLAEPAPATEQVKARAIAALAAATPRGGTDLHGGWLRGCEGIALHAMPGAINRCLLLTDGQANHGVTDPAQIAHHAAELRRRGIQTSAFGVGADFDERLLQGMADAGGGRFYFIEAPAGIPELMSSELGEALEVVVPEATLEVRLPAGLMAEPLNDYPHQRAREENTVRIALGDLASGQRLDVVVLLRFPTGKVGDALGAEFGVVGRDGLPCAPAETVHWTWARHPENDAQPRNVEVDRAVATLYAARARAQATELNRRGGYDDARQVLEATSRRILSYAGSDPVLRRLAAELVEETVAFAAPMDAMALKEQHFRAYTMQKGRDISGSSIRPPRPQP